MATRSERRESMPEVEATRRSSKAQVEASRRSPNPQLELPRKPSLAQVGASRRSPKPQLELPRRPSMTQVDASRRSPKPQLELPRRPSMAQVGASRRTPKPQLELPRKPSMAQVGALRRSPKLQLELPRRPSMAQVDASRRSPKPQLELPRRPSMAQVEASRRPSMAQVEAALQPRRPSALHVDPQQYVSAPQQARRGSNKLVAAVKIVNYMDNIWKLEEPRSSIYSSSSGNHGWYLKRCCICLLLLVSMLTIALAIYLLTGPAGKWITYTEDATTPTASRYVPPQVRQGVSNIEESETPVTTNAATVSGGVATKCEMNATVEHCPSNGRHSSTGYVCPGNGRPCQPVWKPAERCLGPRGPRFSTQKLCELHCFKKGGPCQIGPESCPCTEDYRVFNYVHTKDKGCIPLEEGRCLVKNIRGYRSKADCVTSCQGLTSRGAPCNLEEVNAGHCTWRDKIYKFYFDVEKKSCLPWNDDICQPDAYSSIELCMQMCN
ncbi:uncharacterized protein LOC135400980 [Ornithodoros turicata]|uniref:uncharacterized protein LOC135400980 n=1 Tax=Ornithodoros turicata TaxID=34597 RepID=UPI003139BB59